MDDFSMLCRLLDLTTLEGSDTPARVRSLCERAVDPGAGLPPVAAVCVYPIFLAAAREHLAGSPVRVATVGAAFPSGQYPLEVRLADVRASAEAGADEIDIVVNRGHLLAGDEARFRDEVRAIGQAAAPARLKVILETGELETEALIRRACELVLEAIEPIDALARDGAVFLKTSTGKIPIGATPEATRVMAQAIRAHHERAGVRIGLKIAGGVRSVDDAMQYVAIVRDVLGASWLTPDDFRIGASSLLDALVKASASHMRGQ